MKKILFKGAALLAAAVLSVGCLTACGADPAGSASEVADAPSAGAPETGAANDAANDPANAGDTLHIVTTIFPEYDWVRNILGEEAEHVDLTLLLDNGVDLHSYQPTAADILTISTCDLFVYVGGESNDWVEDVLEESMNPDMQVVELLDVLGDAVREEEVVEGMEADHDHEEDHDHDDEPEEHDHDRDDGPEYDEHVWLSLRNAEVICGALCDALCAADPANAEAYTANAESYTAQLQTLDAEYESVVAAAPDTAAGHTLVFGDRFPFRYLTDDYGLDYYAAFVGCSAETEASFETVTFLAEKVDELQVPCVLIIDGSDGSIARTIVQSSSTPDLPIMTLNSLQSVTADDLAAGITYLSVMEANLEVLTEALG